MKTSKASKTGSTDRGSSGLGTIQLLIILFVMAILGYAGFQTLKVRTGVAGKYSALGQQDMFGLAAKTVSDFYDCVDKTGDFIPAVPQTCQYQEQTYTRPAEFSDANIRNFERLPESAKATVRVIAKKNFAICSDVPETLSVTKVLNVVENHIYLATGCDGGYAAILEHQGLAWREINLGQSGLTCQTAEKHRIPRTLVYNPKVDGSGECYLPNGRTQAVPEKW